MFNPVSWMARLSHLASVFPGECKDTYADKVKKSEFDGLGNVRPRASNKFH